MNIRQEFFKKSRYHICISIIFEFLNVYEKIKISSLTKNVFEYIKREVCPKRLKLISGFISVQEFIQMKGRFDDKDIRISDCSDNNYLLEYICFCFLKNKKLLEVNYEENTDCGLYFLKEKAVRLILKNLNFVYKENNNLKERKVKKIHFHGRCFDSLVLSDFMKNLLENFNPNNNLEKFKFTNCEISSTEFCVAFSKLISNSIQNLKLCFTKCALSKKNLSKMLNGVCNFNKIHLLMKLKLVQCRMNDHNFEILVNILNKHKTEFNNLYEINLSFNDIGSSKALANKFFQLIGENFQRIKILKFEKCLFNEDVLPKIYKLIENKHSIEVLNLEGNSINLNSEIFDKLYASVKTRFELYKNSLSVHKFFNFSFTGKKTPTYIFKIKNESKKDINYQMENNLIIKNISTSSFISEYFERFIKPFPYNSVVYKSFLIKHVNEGYILANKCLGSASDLILKLELEINWEKIDKFFNFIKQAKNLRTLNLNFPNSLSREKMKILNHVLYENSSIKELILQNLEYETKYLKRNKTNSMDVLFDFSNKNDFLEDLESLLAIMLEKQYICFEIRNCSSFKNLEFLSLLNYLVSSSMERLVFTGCALNSTIIPKLAEFLEDNKKIQFIKLDKHLKNNMMESKYTQTFIGKLFF